MTRVPTANRGTPWVRLTLPAAAGSLIGRAAELESAGQLLQEPRVRLLTFTGASGIGKTWLAVEVATACGPGSTMVAASSR